MAPCSFSLEDGDEKQKLKNT